MAIKIGASEIGSDQPVFLVAEISSNHGGNLDRGIALVRAAKQAGADAIKLQTYTADTITINSDKPDFRLPRNSPWAEYGNLWDLYSKAFTPWEWHGALYEEARSQGLKYFSSSFDHTAVDFNETFDVCAHKIASPEITDIPLLKKVAATGKPVIVSTGIAGYHDISLAVTTLKDMHVNNIILLKCTSSYPAPLTDLHLKTIPDIRRQFGVEVGLSDHSRGTIASVLAVGYGAIMIEKHIKIDNSEETIDSHFSSSQEEFAKVCDAVRQAQIACGSVTYEIPPSAIENINSRRSLYVFKTIGTGEILTKDNIRSIRPGYGLHPKHWDEVLGKRAIKKLEVGDALTWDSIL